ncbi:NUDIX hydrolase [Pelagibius sp. CAU 1746]|uniref:NUDIX hydrolase n=1 Tax=Pelagibius sp. CAU 1746 TaxID=3140370 RepID=UPI00325A99D2
MASEAFTGAKIALVCGAELVAYRRDDSPAIPWPGLWDLPGGGREGAETPAGCALREVEEEFGLALVPGRVHWCRRYPAMLDPQRDSYFLAAEISQAEVAAIRFGEEGQYWRMMSIADFLALPDAISHLQVRLCDYLAGRG